MAIQHHSNDEIEKLIRESDVLVHKNQSLKAIITIKQALKFSPSSYDPYLYYLLGIARLKCFCLMLARRAFEKANELLPEHSENYRGLGWTLVLLGDLPKGREYLQKSLLINPSNYWACIDLAMSYIHYFEFEEGCALLKKADELSPDNDFIKQNRSIVNALMKEFGAYRAADLKKMKKEKLRPDLQKEFRLMSLEELFNHRALSQDEVEELREEWSLNRFPGKIRTL